MLRLLPALAATGALALATACGSSSGGTGNRPNAAVFTPTAVAPSGPIVLPAALTLSAPSHDVVWAMVSDPNLYLFRSTDQGRSWQQRPLPPAVGQNVEISFVSDLEGWLKAAGSPETQCNAQSVAIWHTVDGGSTWQQLAARGVADAQCKEGFAFSDATHGFLGAWDQNHRPVIYFTRDGGASWKASAPFPDPPGFNSQPGGFELTAGRVRAFGSTVLVPVFGYQAGARVQSVYQSEDGGATWTYEANAGTSGGGTLALITAAHWLQLILPGQSMETLDGGKTWHISTSDYSQAAPVAPEVVFADGQVGYATVRGEIQLTVDGGQHWTSIKTPGT